MRDHSFIRFGVCSVLAALSVGACSTLPSRTPSPGNAPARDDFGEMQDPGKLQRASDKVSAPSSSDGSRSARRSSSGNFDDDDAWADLCAEIAWVLLGWPWWGPHLALEGSGFDAGYYSRHPYALADEPMIARAHNAGDAMRDPLQLRAHFEYGSDFDAIERLGAAVRLETAVRVGLDASWSHYREELAAGGEDTLDLGDVNVVLRFAQSAWGEMRTGLGVNWFAKSPVRDAGLNFTYGGDFYLGKPSVASFEVDWGTVGAATRFHGRATIGVEWYGVEAFAGFDYESIDAVGLPSWVVGGRVWF